MLMFAPPVIWLGAALALFKGVTAAAATTAHTSASPSTSLPVRRLQSLNAAQEAGHSWNNPYSRSDIRSFRDTDVPRASNPPQQQLPRELHSPFMNLDDVPILSLDFGHALRLYLNDHQQQQQQQQQQKRQPPQEQGLCSYDGCKDVSYPPLAAVPRQSLLDTKSPQGTSLSNDASMHESATSLRNEQAQYVHALPQLKYASAHPPSSESYLQSTDVETSMSPASHNESPKPTLRKSALTAALRSQASQPTQPIAIPQSQNFRLYTPPGYKGSIDGSDDHTPRKLGFTDPAPRSSAPTSFSNPPGQFADMLTTRLPSSQQSQKRPPSRRRVICLQPLQE